MITPRLIHDPNDQRRIPDPSSGHDALLEVQGHWRMPVAWSRERFECVFHTTLEAVLRDVKAGRWQTYTALSKTHGRPSSWASCSLAYCLLREGLIVGVEEFEQCFPLSHQKAQARQTKQRTWAES